MTNLEHLTEHDKARFAARSLEVWNAHNASMEAWTETDKGEPTAEDKHALAARLHNALSFNKETGNAHRKFFREHLWWISNHKSKTPAIVRPLAPDWRRANRDYSYRMNSDD